MLQGEVSTILDHMSKNISRAIGNEKLNGENSVLRLINGPAHANTLIGISVFIDTDANGARDTDIDHYIGYKFDPNTYKISYCSYCDDSLCDARFSTCSGISKNIIRDWAINTNFDTDGCLISNQLTVDLEACWTPSTPNNCGTPDNPSVKMSTNIMMPSVSSN
jgi:hypothetical protein